MKMRSVVLAIVGTAGLFVIVFVLGSAGRDKANVRAYEPVLNSCEDAVTRAISGISESFPFSGRYIAFDDVLRTHPAVVGFVELESAELGQEELAAAARGITTGCRMRYAREYSKAASADAEALFKFLRDVENGDFLQGTLGGAYAPVDPDQVYIVNGQNRITVHYNLSF